MRRAEWEYAARATLALALLTAAYQPASRAYLAALQAFTLPLARVASLVVKGGPGGLTPWMIVAVAVILGSRQDWRRRCVAVIALLAGALTLDALLTLLLAAMRLEPEIAEQVLMSASIVLPFGAVIAFTGGRPSALWSGGAARRRKAPTRKAAKPKNAAKQKR